MKINVNIGIILFSKEGNIYGINKTCFEKFRLSKSMIIGNSVNEKEKYINKHFFILQGIKKGNGARGCSKFSKFCFSWFKKKSQ
jgi:hypothetical protein